MDSETFWKKVGKSDPDACWPWLGGQNADGYGDVWYKEEGSNRGRNCKAHRVAWTLTNGPIPDGMAVLHHCDNRPCCNPAHLWLGTIADNNADMTAKHRQAQGDRHGMATLTKEQVRAIRACQGSQRNIARQFGISQRQVGRLLRATAWKEAIHG